MPVYDHINDDFGKINRLNFVGKMYFLLYDTDIDLIFLTSGSKTSRDGIDFSRNITSNFEIHGELASINDYEKRFINSDGTGRKAGPGHMQGRRTRKATKWTTSSDVEGVFTGVEISQKDKALSQKARKIPPTPRRSRNCDFELKNGSGFCLRGLIAGEGFIPTT